jgi:hypothetical protein
MRSAKSHSHHIHQTQLRGWDSVRAPSQQYKQRGLLPPEQVTGTVWSYEASITCKETGFSVGLSRLVHPALTGNKICYRWALTKLQPRVSASFLYLCSFIPDRMPVTQSLNASSWRVRCLSNSSLHFTQSVSQRSKPALFRPNQKFCPGLLTVHWVVVWELSGSILTRDKPVGTEVHSSGSVLLPSPSEIFG